MLSNTDPSTTACRMYLPMSIFGYVVYGRALRKGAVSNTHPIACVSLCVCVCVCLFVFRCGCCLLSWLKLLVLLGCWLFVGCRLLLLIVPLSHIPTGQLTGILAVIRSHSPSRSVGVGALGVALLSSLIVCVLLIVLLLCQLLILPSRYCFRNRHCPRSHCPSHPPHSHMS